MGDRLLTLLLTFAPLSLMAFGGGQAIISEIQVQSVEAHGWLTAAGFNDLFAISRAAPGPSTLIVALIGWQVAGLLGAIVAALAIFVPSSLLIYGFGTWWLRHRGKPLTTAIERGLMPVAVGLIFAGAFVILQSMQADALRFATIVTALLVLTFTKIGPYTLLISVGVLYYLLAVL
jgi:chromate transporter